MGAVWQNSLPPFLSAIPASLYPVPGSPSWRKRCRCRGKRSRQLVKLRYCLVLSSKVFLAQHGPGPRLSLQVLPGPCRLLAGTSARLGSARLGGHLCVHDHYTCPKSEFSEFAASIFPPLFPCWARLPLGRVWWMPDHWWTKRSSSGIFSLGESSALSVLLPCDCLYFNSQQWLGCGGGLAAVFKLGLCFHGPLLPALR